MNLEKTESFKILKDSANLRKIAIYLGVFLICFVVFVLFAPWIQTAKGSGRVIAYSATERQQMISAPVEGRLGLWHVQEGDRVNKGDLIVEIKDNDPQILNNLLAMKRAILAKKQVAELAVSTAEINVRRQYKLYEQGISSRKTYEQSKLDLAKYESELATQNAELSRIEVEVSRQQSQRVQAPMSGFIHRRIAGQESVLVKVGDVLAELVPDTTSRAVELFLDGNDAPLVHTGDECRLQFEGWPAIQFSGWPSVAVGTFAGKVAFVDAADNGAGMFRAVVVPINESAWPESRYLRQGVRVHGWILLRKVKVWYELWRQFNGFPPQSNKK